MFNNGGDRILSVGLEVITVECCAPCCAVCLCESETIEFFSIIFYCYSTIRRVVFSPNSLEDVFVGD